MVVKLTTLQDIMNRQARWTLKHYRKERNTRHIQSHKHTKKLVRQFQRENHGINPLKFIPKETPYCYTGLSVEEKENGEPIFNISACKFWYSIEIPQEELDNHIGIVAMNQSHIGGCKLLKKTDDDMNGWGLLWDQCKECGLNYGFKDFK